MRLLFIKFPLGDGLSMNLIWSVKQTGRSRLSPGCRKTEVIANSCAAVDLNCPVDYALGHIGRDDLNHGYLRSRRFISHGIHHVCGLQGQESRLLNLDS